jgi:hypothetical protein
MKKYLFIALATAGMLSSCLSDDIVSNGVNPGNEESRQQILIGLGQTVTRGTGTVGGFDDDADNKWNKQVVNIYMLNRNTMDLAVFDPLTDTTPLYDNMTFFTPDLLQTGRAYATDDSIKYYPTQGKFDFWAYRLDDAVTATAEPVRETDSIYVDFTINGSQDVMVAKAVPSKADSIKLGAVDGTPLNLTNFQDRAFSAYAARNGVQPDLKFRHLLSRLTFDVIPGSANTIATLTPVIVDSIKVSTPANGRLTIAALGDVRGEKQTIKWNAELDTLILKQRPGLAPGATKNDSLPLVAFQSVTLANRGDYQTPGDASTPFVGDTVRVGEALLVAPEVTEYEVFVYLHQPTRQKNNSLTTEDVHFSYKDVIKLTANAPFKAGYSYNVQIKLYGLQDIQVTTTLGKWLEGETVTLIPEDQE